MYSRLFLSLITFILVSCGSGNNSEAPKTTQHLSFAPLSSNILLVGKTLTLTSKVPASSLIFYQSSDPSIATVTPTGVVEGLSPGNVAITVSTKETRQHLASSASLQLQIRELQQLVFDQPDLITIKISESVINGLQVKGSPALTYTSSNPTIVTVDTDGRITGNTAGDATIKVSSKLTETHTAAVAEYLVKVEKKEAQLTFMQPDQIEVQALTVLDNKAATLSNGSISYSSSDNDIASVDDDGKVKALTVGTSVITAHSTETDNYQAAEKSYELKVVHKPRTLSLNTIDPVDMFSGDILPIEATTEGPGKISFSSNNEEVASIHNDTEIRALRAGQAIITASIPANNVYAAATNSVQVDIRKSNIQLSAWVGENNAEIFFDESDSEISFYRSNTMNCTISSIQSCTNGAQSNISTTAVIDASFSLDKSAYATLSYKENSESFVLDSTEFRRVRKHKTVTFKEKLWNISGYVENRLSNQISYSENGYRWTSVPSPQFSAREGHDVTVFNGKLWLIGGDNHEHRLPAERHQDYMSDIWSSADGINWVKEVESAPFAGRKNHSLVSHGNKLWLIGGRSHSQFLQDIWQSDDGVTWTKITENAPFETSSTINSESFSQKLWVFTTNLNETSIWSSSEGVNWVKESTNLPANKRRDHDTTVFNNQLWLSGGEEHNDLWSSDDGKNWTEIEKLNNNEIKIQHQLTHFKDRLWIIGGLTATSTSAPNNHIISSTNGQNWQIIKSSVPEITSDKTIVWNEKIAKIESGKLLTSEDGINWEEHNLPGSLPSEISHIISFNSEIWAFSAFEKDIVKAWKSSDAKNWSLISEQLPFADKSFGRITTWENRFWVFASNSITGYPDSWSSEDGINWTEQAQNLPFKTFDVQFVPWNNKLWAFEMYGIWSTINGTDWVKVVHNPAYTRGFASKVVSTKDALYRIGSSAEDSYLQVWKSLDAVNWTKQATTPALPPRMHHNAVVLNDQIFVIGGMETASPGNLYNDTWRSVDGVNWRKAYSRSIPVPR